MNFSLVWIRGGIHTNLSHTGAHSICKNVGGRCTHTKCFSARLLLLHGELEWTSEVKDDQTLNASLGPSQTVHTACGVLTPIRHQLINDTNHLWNNDEMWTLRRGGVCALYCSQPAGGHSHVLASLWGAVMSAIFNYSGCFMYSKCLNSWTYQERFHNYIPNLISGRFPASCHKLYTLSWVTKWLNGWNTEYEQTSSPYFTQPRAGSGQEQHCPPRFIHLYSCCFEPINMGPSEDSSLPPRN